MGKIKTAILTTLRPATLGWVKLGWFVVVAGVFVWCFAPTFNPPPGAPESNMRLDEADVATLRLPTRAEAAMIRRLPMLQKPIAPSFPPAQGQPPRPMGQIFGLRDDQRPAFSRVLDSLRQAQPDCTRRLGGDRTSPAALADAREALASVVAASSQERGFLSYHQGLIDLCGGDPGQARAEFESALADYEEYRNDPEQTPSPESLAMLSQYQMLTEYGLGLAILSAGGRASEADAAFARALEAGRGAVVPDQAGPFVELEACTSGPSCALFNFSSAEIFNARLAAWLAADRAVEAFERVETELAQAPGYVSEHVALAANLSVAAAAAGHFGTSDSLYRTTADLIRAASDDEAAPEPPSRAWSRLAALAVVSPDPIYAEGDPWPTGAPSSTRRTFDSRGFARDTSWFPAVDLEPEDAGVIDRWLWVRRDRHLLESGQFAAYRSDGTAIRNLGPDSREFIEAWREEVTDRLAGALLERAERIRRADGLAEARPLLALVGSPGFPPLQQRMARLGYAEDAPPWWALTWRLVVMLFVVGAAWAHLQLASGYRRTFGNRHYQDRQKQWNQLAPAAERTGDPAP